MPQFEGHLGHTPVVKRIFQRLGHGFVLVIGQDKTVFPEAVQTEFSVAGRCQHSLEGVLIVEAGEAAEDGIGNDRCGVVAYHAVGFPTGEFPDGQFSGFVVDGQHGADEVHAALRLNVHEQRMQAAESVPQGEYGVAVPAIGLVHFSVHSAVLAVYIGIQRGMDGGMVEGGVKTRLVFLVLIGAFHLLKILLPGFLSGLFLVLDGLGIITVQVGLCVFPGNGGNADTNRYLFAGELQIGLLPVIAGADEYSRLREFHIVIDPLMPGPAVGNSVSPRHFVAKPHHTILQRVPVTQVYGNDRAILESIFMHGAPPPGREPGLYTGILQIHFIIPWRGFFPGVGET